MSSAVLPSASSTAAAAPWLRSFHCGVRSELSIASAVMKAISEALTTRETLRHDLKGVSD
eukprot:scaffold301626_cov20-Prasinocladus_malaysianus.AAC.2